MPASLPRSETSRVPAPCAEARARKTSSVAARLDAGRVHPRGDRGKQNVARRRIPTTDLHVSDVLAAPAVYAHSTEVRTIAPALVFVVERDAPLRMELLASTHGEATSVQELVRNDPVAAEFVDIYFGERADGGFLREDRHAERLDSGRPVSALRVIDGVPR